MTVNDGSEVRGDNADSRIRIEQLRLIHGNVGNTTLPTMAVAGVLVAVLYQSVSLWWLGVWFGLIAVNKVAQLIEARNAAIRPFDPESISRETQRLMVIHGIDATLWSSLGWLVLERAPIMPTMLVMAVLSGVISGAASLLAPVQSVFASYFFCGILVLDARFATLHGSDYWPLAAIVNLYVSSMWLQARSNYQASRESIRLRFENISLMEELQQEVLRSQAARQEATDANLAKSRFLAAASHDLRQPIHALNLFLEALTATVRSKKAVALAAKARQAAVSSAEMLNALLDFSRADAGVLTPRSRPLNLQSVFDAVQTDLAHAAAEKGLRLRVVATALVVQADPALVQMIVHNLVSNAIRYTAEGSVLLGARRAGARVRIEVRDSGIGISESDQEAIFEEFRQLGNPERDRRKGLGLGLAIARRVARSFGEDIFLKSRLGAGSLFWLWLPRSAEPAPNTTETPTEPVHQRAPFAAAVILVDDDPANREAMAEVLTHAGFKVRTAAGWSDAIGAATDCPPDIIISDLRLQGPDGLAVIEGVRSTTGQALPALLVTGDTDPAGLRRLSCANAPVLHKPVQGQDLIRAVNQSLERARGANHAYPPR